MTSIDGTSLEIYSLERSYSPQQYEATVSQLGTFSPSLGAVSRKYAMRTRFHGSSYETTALKFRSLVLSGKVVWMEHLGVYTPLKITGFAERMENVSPRSWAADIRATEVPYWGTALIVSASGYSTLQDVSERGSYKVINPLVSDYSWQLDTVSKNFIVDFRVVTTATESFKLEFCIPDNPNASGSAYKLETYNGSVWASTLEWNDSAAVSSSDWSFTDATTTTSRHSYPSSTRGQQVTELQGGADTMRYSWMYGPNRRVGVECTPFAAKTTRARLTVNYQNDTTTMVG